MEQKLADGIDAAGRTGLEQQPAQAFGAHGQPAEPVQQNPSEKTPADGQPQPEPQLAGERKEVFQDVREAVHDPLDAMKGMAGKLASE